MKKQINYIDTTELPIFINRFFSYTTESEASDSGKHYHISAEQYKSIVIKDIENLLNFSVSKTEFDERFYYVKNSVLAYGGCSYSGEALSPHLIEKLKDNIISCLMKYEPRIKQNTIILKYLEEKSNYSKVQFCINAELVSIADDNINVTLSINLESGECLVCRK